MKEAIVSPDISVKIVDSPIPTPNDDQVLIKVLVSGTNPKDWKLPKWTNTAHNSGDDIAGEVVSVGKNVYEFRAGDRVAAFHEMKEPHGSFAEYGIAHDYATIHIPHNVSYEAAATLPLAYLTSAVGIYLDLQVPEPWSPLRPKEGEKVPILIYGASSATGLFAAQLARLSGLLVIGVAGNASELAKSVSDYVVDYRQGEDALVKSVEEILKKEGLSPKLKLIYDAISENGSHEANARLVDPNGGKVTHLLPVEKFAKSGPDFKYPDGVTSTLTSVGTVFKGNRDFGYAIFKYLTLLLKEGKFKTQPYEVIPGGLEGVKTGLDNLYAGKASGVKYIYRIPDTPGAGKDVPKI